MLALVTKSLVDTRASGIVRSRLWLDVLGIPLGFLFRPLCICQLHSQSGFSYGNKTAATVLVITSECPLHREEKPLLPIVDALSWPYLDHVEFTPKPISGQEAWALANESPPWR